LTEFYRPKQYKAINKALTARNWLIGLYIVEFEQHGEDRAEYGAKLLDNLAKEINSKGLSARNLKLYRQFYLAYPTLNEAVKEYISLIPSVRLKLAPIVQSSIAQLQIAENEDFRLDSKYIFDNLSYTHFIELTHIKDPLKRTFYEMECIKCVWTHKELQHQIHSLYLERMGLSEKPEKLAELVQRKNVPATPADLVKDVFLSSWA
jgi:hypothetical protein